MPMNIGHGVLFYREKRKTRESVFITTPVLHGRVSCAGNRDAKNGGQAD